MDGNEILFIPLFHSMGFYSLLVLFFLMAFSFYGTLGVFKEQNTHV
jgi:hypothetical protein